MVKWCGLSREVVKSCFPGDCLADVVWNRLQYLHWKETWLSEGSHHRWLRVCSLCVCVPFNFLFFYFSSLFLSPWPFYISHSTHFLADCLRFPTPFPPCSSPCSLFSTFCRNTKLRLLPASDSRTPVASWGESRWNRFSNGIIPHLEATVLPEKLVDP